MDTNLTISVGDYVTWGSEFSAHLVTCVTPEGVHVGGRAFDVDDKSNSYPVRSQYLSFEGNHIRVVQSSGTLKVTDLVEKPAHYARFIIEPITFIMKNKLEFWRGNPIKYIARAGHKPYPGQTAEQSEVTDIKKAIRMLEMRLNDIEGKDEL